MSKEQQESKLQRALYLIKFNMGAHLQSHDADLHEAIQLIVDVAREHDLLIR